MNQQKLHRILAACLLTVSFSLIALFETSTNDEKPLAGDDVSFEDVADHVAPFLGQLEKGSADLVALREPSAIHDDGLWSEAKPGEVFPVVSDARVLMLIENKGFHLQDILEQKLSDIRTNDVLYKRNKIYREFTDFAAEDIASRAAEENKYRPDWGDVGPGFGHKRRNLDPRWLKSGLAHYELVGVVNRIDRLVFDEGTCGETRLIYRLAYISPKIASRLPLTVNVVFFLKGQADASSCLPFAKEWTAPQNLQREQFAAWMMAQGPLRAGQLSMKNLKSIETNYQVIRSSAAIRNMLGGAAEYVLRVFHVENGELVRATLENTPDVERLQKDPRLKQELVDFLKSPQNFEALDHGYLKIPDKFLAKTASSYSPHGIGRMDNRPFDKIVSESDFASINFDGRKFVKTPGAALRRLNDLSCVGCHQNRTIAGFHFLGEDRPGTHPLNAIFFAGSGHFRAELVRRRAFLKQLLSGGTPSPDRPFSIAPTTARAQYGDFCGLPGSKAFANWVCADGLKCAVVDPAHGETELGNCEPEVRLSGDSCLRNVVTQNHHALDKMEMPATDIKCAGGDSRYDCRIPGLGFPNGMCTSSCKSMTSPNEICGPVAGPGFSACITDPNKSFNECLEQTEKTGSRGRCNGERSCRIDYVCAKVAGSRDGACLPSYFLFQIRADGHPSPQ